MDWKYYKCIGVSNGSNKGGCKSGSMAGIMKAAARECCVAREPRGHGCMGRHIDGVGVISLLLRARGNSAINNNTDGVRE